MSSIIEHYISSTWQRLKRSPLFKDSLWSLIGSTVGRGLSLVAGILVARFLGKDLYGEYGILKTTLIYIEIFSTFGLGYTATKFIADFRQSYPGRVSSVCRATLKITLATSGIMAMVVLLFAKQIAIMIDAPHLYNTLRITAVGVIVNAINVAQIGILSGFGDFKVIAKNTTIVGVVTFFLTIVLTYYWGLNGAVIALVLSYGCQCLINNLSVHYRLRQFEAPKERDKGLYKELLVFSSPVALQESLYSIVNWAISFMLIKVSGYGELGLYSAAAQWSAIISFIPGILRNVTLSHLSGNLNNQSAHEKTMRAMLGVNLASTSIMMLFILLFINPICSMYGDTFEGLKLVIVAQAFCAIVTSLSNVYAQEFMSRGANWPVFFCRLVRDVAALLISYFVIIIVQGYGALILSLSLVISNILYLVALYYLYKQQQRKRDK